MLNQDSPHWDMSPVFIAVKLNFLDALKLFIDVGFDISCKTSDGLNLLDLALKYKSVEVYEYLHDNFANKILL